MPDEEYRQLIKLASRKALEGETKLKFQARHQPKAKILYESHHRRRCCRREE